MSKLLDTVVKLQTVVSQEEYPDPCSNQRKAAVLVSIVAQTSRLILTKRSENLSRHQGQISFPGGKHEQQDSNLMDTAIRESNEEIGIQRAQVKALGYLPKVATLSGFLIQPILAVVEDTPNYLINPEEVQYVLEVPMTHALALENYEKHTIMLGKQGIEYYQIFYQDERIWGATAQILYDLARALTLP